MDQHVFRIVNDIIFNNFPLMGLLSFQNSVLHGGRFLKSFLTLSSILLFLQNIFIFLWNCFFLTRINKNLGGSFLGFQSRFVFLSYPIGPYWSPCWGFNFSNNRSCIIYIVSDIVIDTRYHIILNFIWHIISKLFWTFIGVRDIFLYISHIYTSSSNMFSKFLLKFVGTYLLAVILAPIVTSTLSPPHTLVYRLRSSLFSYVSAATWISSSTP